MENESKPLTQNFFNEKLIDAVYELMIEGMKDDPDCANTTIEDLKNEPQIKKMVEMSSVPNAIALTLNLICEKLNVTEIDGLNYLEKIKPQMLEMALKKVKESSYLL